MSEQNDVPERWFPERIWIPRAALDSCGGAILTKKSNTIAADVEYVRATTPVPVDVEAMRAALQKIIDRNTECECEHDTEYCCARVDEYCPSCIAFCALESLTTVPSREESDK